MKRVFLTAVLLSALPGVADAQPLKPMEKGSFDGIPFDQAMSTLRVLGKWILPRDGTVQVFTMGGGPQKGCIGAETDSDECHTARLYVAAEDSLIETKGLTTNFGEQTYFLLRGVNGTGWFLPEKETLKFITEDRFSLRVCGSKFTTELSGGAIVPTFYTLHISRTLQKDKKYSFSAKMEKYNVKTLAPWTLGCGDVMARDENFHTVPALIKPGKAPR